MLRAGADPAKEPLLGHYFFPLNVSQVLSEKIK